MADRHSLVLVGLTAVGVACLVFGVMRLVVTLQTGKLTPWWANAAGFAAIVGLYVWYRRKPRERTSVAAHGTAVVATLALLFPLAYAMSSTIWWLSLVGFAMVLLGRRREAKIWGPAILALVVAAVVVEPHAQVEGAAGETPIEAALSRIVFVVILLGMAYGFRRVAEQRARELFDSRAELDALKRKFEARALASEELAYQRMERLEQLNAELTESEARLKQAQQVAQIGHWALTSYDGTPTWSDEIFRIFGLEPNSVEPSFTEHDTIIHPDEWPVLDRAVRAGFDSGQPFDLTFRILRPENRIGWMHAIGRATKDEAGRVTKLFGTAQDITERVQMRQERDEANRRLELALRSVNIGLWDYYPLENRASFSDEWKRQLGYEPHELPDRVEEWTGRMHPDDAEYVEANLQDYIARGEAEDYSVEFRLRHRDGSYRWILAMGRAVAFEGGQVSRMIGCHLETTERREMEAQLSQADRLSSMGMLAAGVAHEINNPLSYVMYNLESLTEDLPLLVQNIERGMSGASDGQAPDQATAQPAAGIEPEMVADILARFEETLGGTRRIRDIARGLGTFSRVEGDRLVPVDINHVIDVAVNMSHNEIKYRARLTKDFGELPTIMASEGRLSQVFLNMLINASHAIEEGHVEDNEIKIRTWSDAGAVLAEVSDTGSGIPEENLRRLFDPFFTTKKIGVGSGLGLSISRNIVESYGGSISVQSEPGVGTRFTIRLPVRAEEAQPATEPPGPEAAPHSRGRILIVDDERPIRASMVRMLRDHDTTEAASGAEAKTIIQAGQGFDLILCDMMMPDVSGMDLHKWLVQRFPPLAERLIFITGGAFTPKAREYLNEVDNLRLEKPFDVPTFKKIVDEQIELARTAQPAPPGRPYSAE